MNEETRDLREHHNRTRLAETYGARDESPSSNLGRLKQGEAIRADVMKPRIDGRWTPRRMSAHMLWRGGIEDAPKLTTLSESEQYVTPSSNHGVPWKRREYQDRAQLLEEQVDVHLKTLASSVDEAKPDHEREGSGRQRSHLTRF